MAELFSDRREDYIRRKEVQNCSTFENLNKNSKPGARLLSVSYPNFWCTVARKFYRSRKLLVQHLDVCLSRSKTKSAQSNQSSLCAQWEAKDLRFRHADNEDWSDWCWWSESLLGAQAILLVLSCCSSFLTFLHQLHTTTVFVWKNNNKKNCII